MTSGTSEQPLNGSPVYPVGQVQMALWFTAVHLNNFNVNINKITIHFIKYQHGHII